MSLVNIDAINPDWPRSIYLPDEEETLDKQVASGAVAARERGLVPQSGDWERPYRWVTPREMYGIGVGEEEIEAPESEEDSEMVERVKVYTGSDEPFTQFDEAKIATRTDPGFAGRGAYTTTDPKKAARWGKHVMETTIPSDASLIPIHGISELYEKYGLESLTFEESELSKEQRNLIYAKKINEFTDRMLDEGYDGVKWMMSTGDTQYVLFKPGKYEFAVTGQESSSYEMPKYDLSWDTLVESKDKSGTPRFKAIEIRPIPDASREFLSRAGAVDTDNFSLVISPSEVYFGETEEDVKSKMLKEYVAPEGEYVSQYYPPRLTPKPDWATDESDPFPEIPSDIEVIHYDDLPEFYSQRQFGEPLELENLDDFKGKLKWIIAKANAENDYHSEIFSNAFQFTDDGEDIDYSTSASWIADELNWSKHGSTNIKVTAGEAKSVARQAREQTQKSLLHRGLPEKFYVFRGGPVHAESVAMPTSLSPGAALSFSQKAGKPYIAMYEVNREDVLLDVNSMRLRSGTFKSGEDEHELVIQGRHLKNQRMIQLPNPLIKESEFRKSKSLDKQAVATSEPPDQSVAARMKARGLEWKKETHRWVRPEDAEEEEPQIHELNGHLGSDRKAYLQALINRHDENLFELSSDHIEFLNNFTEEVDRTVTMAFREFEENKKDGGLTNRQAAEKAISDNFSSSNHLSAFHIPTMLLLAKNKVKDGWERDEEFEIKEIEDSIIAPYLISQLSLVGNDLFTRIKEGDDDSFATMRPEQNRLGAYSFGALTGNIDRLSGLGTHISMVYADGVLDIDDAYAPIAQISRDLSSKLSQLQYNLNKGEISQTEFDKTIQFARDNLFKLVKRGDKVHGLSIPLKLYEISSQEDKAFMREALLNSLKDEELVLEIQGNFGVTASPEIQDVITGINHLTLAIYADMVRNGDIDDLVEFFSDENIPTGLFHTKEHEEQAFYFLSENMSVDEFGVHVDAFLSGGEILRKGGIEALSYIDPSHPSLLAMVDTEDNPDVINLLAQKLPVTTELVELMDKASYKRDSIDVDKLHELAMKDYAEKHGMDYERIVSPDDEGYAEFRAERGKQIAYATKAIALDKRAVAVFDTAQRNVDARLNVMSNVGLNMADSEAFREIARDDEDISFVNWVDNLSDEFTGVLEKGFSNNYYKPGLPEVFDELYYGTLFGKMHSLSKGAWEASSSTAWGGALKESVGRQFDDEVIFHNEMNDRESIDEALESERDNLFIPEQIRFANFTQENLDRYVRMHKQMTRALLDVALPDSDTVEVFRGTSANELSAEEYNTLSSADFSSTNIQSNSLSSYSLNHNTAQDHFATSDDGIVINIPELHKDNIWSTFFSHSYEGGEREILVINHSDMDAYAKSTNELMDTEQFNPEGLGLNEIEYTYGTGHTHNQYIDEFGSADNLADVIEQELGSGTIGSPDFVDYMDSPQYDSVVVSYWVKDAAIKIMDYAKENYDYQKNATRQQLDSLVFLEDYEIVSNEVLTPDDIFNSFPKKSDLEQTIFEALQEEGKSLEDEDEEDEEEYTEEDRELIESYDSEKYKKQAENEAGNIWEWAEEGQEKVSGI